MDFYDTVFAKLNVAVMMQDDGRDEKAIGRLVAGL